MGTARTDQGLTVVLANSHLGLEVSYPRSVMSRLSVGRWSFSAEVNSMLLLQTQAGGSQLAHEVKYLAKQLRIAYWCWRAWRSASALGPREEVRIDYIDAELERLWPRRRAFFLRRWRSALGPKDLRTVVFDVGSKVGRRRCAGSDCALVRTCWFVDTV